jgi:methylisocitrate lyase
MLGRPDLGVVGATQIADRATTLAPALGGVPMLADADIGYGLPMHAVWTAQAYVRAGISGLQLGDEDGDVDLAVARISALAAEVPELAVIARTSAVERCAAYAAAGAHAVLPAGVDDPAELGRLHAELPGVPLVLSRTEATGGRAAATDAELAAAGVRLVLHPVTALLAALRAASQAYRAILDDGSAVRVDRMPWAAFTDLIGVTPDPDTRYVPGRLQT